MRQLKLSAEQAMGRPRRIEHFRRSTWSPRRARRAPPVEMADNATAQASDYIPGEFEEPPRFPALKAVKRVFGLTWDISLLLLLSPIFAGWFLYRIALRFIGTSR